MSRHHGRDVIILWGKSCTSEITWGEGNKLVLWPSQSVKKFFYPLWASVCHFGLRRRTWRGGSRAQVLHGQDTYFFRGPDCSWGAPTWSATEELSWTFLLVTLMLDTRHGCGTKSTSPMRCHSRSATATSHLACTVRSENIYSSCWTVEWSVLHTPRGLQTWFSWRKKDGSLRLCIDFRQLNSRAVKDSYALPRIENLLDALAESTT